MLSLKSRQDGFRLLLPKNFICDELQEKYSLILQQKHSFYTNPIDFINESIQKVEVMGFQDATIPQQLPYTGQPIIDQDRTEQNRFQYPVSDYNWRSCNSPIALIDKTLNIEFRHTLGYLNYFMLFENFWYMYSRDRAYNELAQSFSIDLFNERGVIYSRVVIEYPIMNAMDMLSFDFSQPIATTSTFKIEFKYSNFDYQILDLDDEDDNQIQNSASSGDIILDNC